MTLLIDAAAIASNASIIRSFCAAADLVATAVFKPAYALPQIVEAVASSGIAYFYASSADTALRISRLTGRDCGIIGPSAARHRLRYPKTSGAVFAEPLEARAILRSTASFVWLPLMTSDGRDGLAADTLLRAVADLTDPGAEQSRIGVALNWGCLGAAPCAAELEEIGQLLAQASSVAGRLLPVSLGGSALLPLLDRLRLPGARELRIGEAILTGAIPDSDGRRLGLRSPMRLCASAVDVQSRPGGQRRLLLDRGWTSIEVSDVRVRGIDARPVGASAEISLFDLNPEAESPRVGQTVELLLGYKSSLRALLNRRIPRRIIDRPPVHGLGAKGEGGRSSMRAHEASSGTHS